MTPFNLMKIPIWLVFNFITTGSINSLERIPFLNKRLKSMYLDLLYILVIFFPWIIIISLAFSFLPGKFEYLSFSISIVEGVIVVITVLNKDLCNGRSIAKRVLGYQIIDIKTNEVASDFKCMLRNITFFIFPVEVIFTLLKNERRFGDLIAGTKVIKCDSLPKESLLSELNGKKNISFRLISVSFVVAIFTSLWLNNIIWLDSL